MGRTKEEREHDEEMRGADIMSTTKEETTGRLNGVWNYIREMGTNVHALAHCPRQNTK